MNQKNFSTITTKDCVLFYKRILANSNQKWVEGEALAESGNYGTAISMTIISTEELIKSILIFIDSKGYRFRKVKGMNSLFKDHQIRYFIAYSMFIMGVLGEDLFEFIRNFRENPDKVTKFIDRMKNDKPLVERTFKFYAYKKMILLRNELEWFSKVNGFRQNGFYCDYTEEAISLTKDDYQKVFERLGRVKKIGSGIFDFFDNEFNDEQFKKYKAQLKSPETYRLVEMGLSYIRHKDGPFNFMKDKFESNVATFIRDEKPFSKLGDDFTGISRKHTSKKNDESPVK